jgi:NADPH:quinone reductase-like Zn-dependent oxidoreductase
MNAAVLHTLGQPPICEQFPDPVPGAGEVLVEVRAAALKPVDKQMASGTHYASYRNLPAVCGNDGAGVLQDGTRVFFAMPRTPYGAMAQSTVVARPRCFPRQQEIDDETAAAVLNPGLSAWGALVWRAQLAAGETVLILGATGVTGKLAIHTAKLLGAKRVVAAGRNQRILASLHDLGADATIPLDQPHPDLVAAFAREAGETGFDVILESCFGTAHRSSIGHHHAERYETVCDQNPADPGGRERWAHGCHCLPRYCAVHASKFSAPEPAALLLHQKCGWKPCGNCWIVSPRVNCASKPSACRWPTSRPHGDGTSRAAGS